MHKKLSLGIQSLKGIAAIMVFLSHSLHQFPNKTIETLHDSCLHFFFDGQIAVIIFMAISGFFYYKPNEKINFKGYICKIENKVRRIYTPYIIVMICAFVALIYFPTVDSSRYTEWAGQFWTHSVTIKQLLYQLTILFMGDANILNPPIWYLKCEVEMFLVMPIVAYLFQKNKNLTFLSFFILFFLFRGYAIIYLLGMLTHYLILEYPKATRAFSKKENQIPLVCLSIAMLNIFNELSISHLGMSRFSCLLYERIIQGGGALILITLIYINSFGFLQKKLPLFIGNISYEIYLSHFVVLLIFRRWFDDTLLFILITFCLTIIFSSFLHISLSKLMLRLQMWQK